MGEKISTPAWLDQQKSVMEKKSAEIALKQAKTPLSEGSATPGNEDTGKSPFELGAQNKTLNSKIVANLSTDTTSFQPGKEKIEKRKGLLERIKDILAGPGVS